MPSIPQDFIDQVRSSTDIVSVVSQYVPLKPSGSSFKGLCPFHSEKTPSFHVNPERQIFHCFGCNQGGDAFKFLMLYEKLSFVESVSQLAARAGLSVPTTSGARKEDDERSLLVRLHEEAAKYYQSQLTATPQGSPAMSYLSRRGLSKETIADYGLGYAPDAWSGLLDHLTRKGARPEHVERAGLAIPRKSGQGYYDRFRGRVMIPIRGESSKIVAFGGRILGSGEPKYLNSPESPIYSKSGVLYGFHRAKEAIRKEGFVILMEGYMDCLQAYQAGLGQAVACCGTSLTRGHSRLLRRYADRVVVNFDPDEAGERATRRSIDLLLEEGFDVRVLTLPGGLDPDRFLLEKGADRYRELLDGARSFVEFLIGEARKRYDVSDPRGKAAFLNDVLPVIGKIPNRVERVGYIGPLAEHAGITDLTVLTELRRHVETQAHRFQIPTRDQPVLKLAERELIRWIMTTPEQCGLLDEIEEEDLEDLFTAPILRAMKEVAASGPLAAERLMDRLPSDEVRNQLTRILMEPSPLGPRQSPRDCLDGLRRERWQRQLSRLRARLAARLADGADDGSEGDRLIAEINSLARRIETVAMGTSGPAGSHSATTGTMRTMGPH
jgi:DNA primase